MRNPLTTAITFIGKAPIQESLTKDNFRTFSCRKRVTNKANNFLQISRRHLTKKRPATNIIFPFFFAPHPINATRRFAHSARPRWSTRKSASVASTRQAAPVLIRTYPSQRTASVRYFFVPYVSANSDQDASHRDSPMRNPREIAPYKTRHKRSHPFKKITLSSILLSQSEPNFHCTRANPGLRGSLRVG